MHSLGHFASEPGWRSRTGPLFAALVLIVLAASPIAAQSVVHASPDKTIPFEPGGAGLADHEVGFEAMGWGVARIDLGPLPEATAIQGVALVGNDRLFVVDRPTALPGLLARPRDVVRYDGTDYSLAFDGGAAGLGDGAAIDALSTAGRDLLLSFETSETLPGGLHVRDHDVIRRSAAGFSLEFDSAAAGIDPAWDVDAIHFVATGRWQLSFDTAGSIDGIVFADEDLLLLAGGRWSRVWDASTEDAAWSAADLDAVHVPEPGFVLSSLFASGGLFWLGRRARRPVAW